MRIIHTSDWHLGKRLFKLDRGPEHELFLNWLISTLKENEIDLLLIAGDIFDTPTPPHQSLEMFYQFLAKVSGETKTQTLIIAGNHDSGILLEAPAELLKHHRVRVWGKLSDNPQDHWPRISINSQEIEICAIPFFRSYELLHDGQGDILEALKKFLQKDKSVPQILLMHHLAGIFEAAGSEQVISLSGIDSIPVEMIKEFDYVALGHIHKPQKISSQAYYSGSPIQLRFSEKSDKSIMLIEIDDNSVFHIKSISIPIFRELFCIKATEENWKEKIHNIETNSKLSPVAEVQLELKSPQSGIINEIKEELEKKSIELLSYQPSYAGLFAGNSKKSKIFEMGAREIFEEFYITKFPESKKVPDELMNDFNRLLERVKNASPQT